MSIFSLVKENVSARQVAEYYGLTINRNGMACCPFHNDKMPSMKLNERFYCFGCGEKGDAVDYVAKYFSLSPKKAAQKICEDFGLAEESRGPTSVIETAQINFDARTSWRIEQYVYRILSEYHHCLQKWKKEYAPRSPDEEWHPYFVEALHETDRIAYLLDTMLEGNAHDRTFLVSTYGKELLVIEKRLREIKQNRNREVDRSKQRVKKKSDRCR